LPFWPPPFIALNYRDINVIIQPEKRLLIVWTVLTALAVAMVLTVNLMVRVRAI
jgi:hypothetical protein